MLPLEGGVPMWKVPMWKGLSLEGGDYWEFKWHFKSHIGYK